jgi:DNA-binding TFAR19-related protein (PDSD5 family)
MTVPPSDPKGQKSAPRTPDLARASESDERSIAMKDLHASLKRLLDETPRKQWYRIKGVRAETWEAVELLKAIHAVGYLLKSAPEKLVMRIMAGEIDAKAFENGFRNLRDRINSVRDACQDLAELAKVELRIWSEKAEPEEAPLTPFPTPGETPKLKTAG